MDAYSKYQHNYLDNLLKDKGKIIQNKITDEQKHNPKKVEEKKLLKNIKNDKTIKEPQNNIIENKEKGIKDDTSNPDLSNSKTKHDQSDNYNEIINQILSQKETKLLTNSQYVSFENQIGDNSCYINVIMHFLYIFPCVNDYLIKKYQEQSKEKEKEKENEKEVTKEPKKEELEQLKKEGITQTPKETITKKPEDSLPSKKKKKKKENEFNDFLFNLGKVLNSYQDILAANNIKNNITNLNTKDLRKSLSICSNNQFQFNCISDPIEFLIYILDLINKENSDEIHSYFQLKLIEEVRCSNFCPFKSNKKYDKDNFIYQIYVEEIFNFIKNQKLIFDDYKENLFMLSYYSLKNEVTKCEKCKSIKNRILICNNEDGSPKFLLVNCVWNNERPDLKEVIKFLYFISLVEKLDNLFICPSKTENTNYYLIGMIFYSFALCHYINLIFNLQKNVFTLYNDTGIMEFQTINEVYKYITIEQLRKNSKAYFYPVLLVYCKENIYEEQTIVLLKRTNKINYELLLDECDKLTKVDDPKEKPLTEEEKKRNYQELFLAQIKFESTNREKNFGKESDDIFHFLRNNEKDYSEKLKKMNIDNDLKKIKSNNYLQKNKTNSKVNKYSSLDQKFLEPKRSNKNNYNNSYINNDFSTSGFNSRFSNYYYRRYNLSHNTFNN